MDITVKRVPDGVYRAIKREAKQQGRSLNAEIIRTLEAAAAGVERRRRLGALRKELDRFAGSLPMLDDSTPLIRADRNR
jgi:plasmid stability protein